MNRYLSALLVAFVLTAAPSVATAQNCADCASACGQCSACRSGYPCQQCGCNGGGACITCPTPGTCTADGICYPKRATWGHYQGGWRRWPGDYDDPLPPGAAGTRDSTTPDVVLEIDPEDEDLVAPPSSDEEADEEASGEGDSTDAGAGAGDALPPLPPIAPPGGLGRPAGGLGAPPVDSDPPPSLPSLPGFGPSPLSSPPGAGFGDGFSSLPPLPTPIARSTLNGATRAGYAVPAVPQEMPVQSPVRQASVVEEDHDLPPALPASFGVLFRGE